MPEHDTFVMRAVTQGWVLLLNGDLIHTFGNRADIGRVAFAGLELARQRNRAAQLYRQDAAGQIALVAKVGAGADQIGGVGA